MSVIRNPQVEVRQVNYATQQGTGFLTRFLDAPVAVNFPNVPVATATKGYRVHFLSRNEVTLPQSNGRQDGQFSLFMQALHASFADHVPFTLSPEAAWYLVAHEVAVHIRLNQDLYRGHFTSSSGKDTIHVRDDSLVYGSSENLWGRSINKVREPMAAKVPQATIDLMLPQFSTSSFESDTALLVLFLDMVANYYGLEWHTLCGIPEVRVEGSPEDWRTIVNHAEMAEREFPGLRPYFHDLLPVLREISTTQAGAEPDPGFWNSFYKYGGGSGGPYINGWITSFLAHRMTPDGYLVREDLDWRKNAHSSFSGLTSDDLPMHLSNVPFVWDYYGQRINMAFMAGMMGVEYRDGFLNPKLGYAVLENTQARLKE